MPFIAPVVGAIASAVAGAASFVGTLGIVGKALIGVGLQLAANVIAKKSQKSASNEPRGTQLEVQYGGAEPRQIGVGRFATAGQDVYTNTFGQANVFIQKVFVLSDFPIDGVNRVAVNGEWKAFVGAEDHRGQSIEGYANDLWIKIHRGLPGTGADAHLVGTSNPAGRWTGDHRGTGVAYAVVLARYEDERMSSFPTLLFECRGLAYDPRGDSTVGGVGPQRFADVSTWSYSENPIVLAYTYERGFFTGGELILGKGMPSADLPLGPWMAAMNVCDEPVEGEARYRAGLIFTAADGTTHRDNLEPILNAAGAALVERVDGDLPIIGATQPVVATLTDDDLIVGQSVVWQAKRSRSELINAVHGSYNKPADLWSQSAYPPQRDATALAVDRERHAVQVDFQAVFSERQATTLALQALRENRYQTSASIVVRPRWIVLEVGDWVRWESAKRGSRIYRVVGRELAPLGASGARNVSLSLQEVGPGIYDQSVIIPEGPGRVRLNGPVYQSTLDNFLAFPSSAEAENGRVYPVIVAHWDEIEDVTVDEVVVEYWKADDPANRIQKRVRMPERQIVIAEGILPETDYVLQGTVVTSPPRTVFWSRSQTVRTLREDLAVSLAALRADIRNVLAFGTESLASFASQIEELAANTAAASIVLQVENERGRAAFLEERTLRVTADEALARRTDGVRAELDTVGERLGGVASAVETMEARVTATEASAESLTGVTAELDRRTVGQADALSSLNATVREQGSQIVAEASRLDGVQARAGEATAQGLSRMEVRAGPSGVSARFAQVLRVSTGAAYSDAGFFIDVRGDGVGTAVFDVTRFILTDSNSKFTPFRFENGTAYLNALVAGSVLVEGTVTARELVVGGVTMSRIGFGAVSNFASGERGEFENQVNTEVVILAHNVRATTSKFINLVASTTIGYGPNQTNATVTILLRINGTEVARRFVPSVAPGTVLEIEYRNNFPIQIAEGEVANVQFTIHSTNALVRPRSNRFSALSFVR